MTTATDDRIELRRKRDFGATINVVFEFVRKNWRPLGKSLLFIVGPAILIASVVSGFYLRSLLGVMTGFEERSMTNPLEMFNDVWPMVILSSLAGVLSTIFQFAVVSGYVRRYVELAPETIDVNDVWDEVKGSFWNVTGTMIFAIILIGLPMLVLALPAMIMREPLLLLLLFFSFPVVIYLYNCFSILIPMRLEEDIGIFDAVRRTMYLMKGRWWFSFWISFVMVLIVSFVGMVFQVPLQAAIGFSTFTGGDSSGWFLFAAMAFSTIGTYLLYSLLFLSCSVLYYNLVEHKEGIGMAERISEIGAGAPGI